MSKEPVFSLTYTVDDLKRQNGILPFHVKLYQDFVNFVIYLAHHLHMMCLPQLI